MTTKDWKKGKYHSWVRKDGTPITNYGRTQLYPFIQIGTVYSTKTMNDSYRVMRHGTHTTQTICEVKKRSEALKCAKRYMRLH